MKKRNDKTELKLDFAGNYEKLVKHTKEAVRDLLGENKLVMTLQKKYYEQIDSKRTLFLEAVSECNMMKKDAMDYVKGGTKDNNVWATIFETKKILENSNI